MISAFFKILTVDEYPAVPNRRSTADNVNKFLGISDCQNAESIYTAISTKPFWKTNWFVDSWSISPASVMLCVCWDVRFACYGQKKEIVCLFAGHKFDNFDLKNVFSSGNHQHAQF